ncbi:MAG: iron ABC transporter permease [Acidimicrobiia bacterium]|nr:iron ABC transporter permease [Acidimicrobiia bacterium]
MRRTKRRFEAAALAFSTLFLGLFFAYPLVRLFTHAFSAASGDRVADVLVSSTFAQTLWFTLWQAIASTLLTFAVGLPAAAVLARYRFVGRSVVRALITVPFVLPTVVVAGAFRALFDRFGVQDALVGSVWAILVAHVFFNVAVVVRVVGSFWGHLDPATEQAARVLGASPAQTFRRVTLPLLGPAMAAAAAIVLLFTFTSFGVILLLGDGRHPTVETEIWRYGAQRLELDVAAGIAVVQLLAVIALSVASTVLQSRHAVAQRLVGDRERARRPRTRREATLVVVTLGPLLVFLIAPLVVLIERSIDRGRDWSIEAYRELTVRSDLLGTSPLASLGNSLRVAGAATLIAVITGTIMSFAVVYGRRRWSSLLDTTLLLPLGTSAVTLGFGLFLAFDRTPLDWRTSWWMLPIAHALIGIPFVVRSEVPVLRSLDHRLRAVAATLGASPARVLRAVDLPVAARAISVGAAFAFVVSMGEFGAASVLPRASSDITAPLAIFRLLGTPGGAPRTLAFALSVSLFVVVAVAVALIDRLRPPGGQSGW